MPLQFTHVCDLLETLEKNQRPRPGHAQQQPAAKLIGNWFHTHRATISSDAATAPAGFNYAALLSTLLPEKRTDRVYRIGQNNLEKRIARALCLGKSRAQELAAYRRPDSAADLADCVERLLQRAPNEISSVTVDEIDRLLHRLAAACHFSSPAVRRSSCDSDELGRSLELCEVYKILLPRDAKWLTRLILKNYQPLVISPQDIYRACHPLLPTILKVQDDFANAGKVLRSLERDRTVTGGLSGVEALAQYLKPVLGVKVGRQQWFKGRGIEHCLNMSHGRISCEEKIDGEYCQIHIDLSKGHDSIQIFSKSGKDSTRDRAALHPAIRESLKLGRAGCPLKTGCILEGELVVYSDKDARVLDFYKIRKHVSRSGCYIGVQADSQGHQWEHLMIIYYDVLMIDGESLLGAQHSERFRRLRQLVTCVEGRSALVERRIIDCSKRSTAASDLRRAFAECITKRKEGLVLKPDEPYFDFGAPGRSCHPIKLKKGYIRNFGDVGDFAVVGARYDAAKAKGYGIPGLKWTHFYIGCLANKEEVQRWGARPEFIVTSVVELNATQLEFFITSVAPRSMPESDNDSIKVSIAPGIDNGRRPTVIFSEPPVFDITCFSFDKEGNTGFWSPRFPSVSKIHCDRTYLDAITFEELQEMARAEREQPPPEDSQELLDWIATLEKVDSKGAAEHSSQATVSSTTTAASTATTMTPTPTTTKTKQPLGHTQPNAGTSPLLRAVHPQWSSQPTPSKPSTANPLPQDDRGETTTDSSQESISRPKRPHSPSPSQTPRGPKARRYSKDQHEAVTARSPSQGEMPAAEGAREPLSDIATTSPRRNRNATSDHPRLRTMNSMYAQPLGNQPPLASDSAHMSRLSLSFATTSEGRPTTTAPSATIQQHRHSMTDATRSGLYPKDQVPGKCTYCPDSCGLAEHSFLLAPCIASIPWVTEDLLPNHGVINFIVDPRKCSEPPDARGRADVSTDAESSMLSETCGSSSITTTTTNINGTTKKRRKRTLKIVLVEGRRKEATAAFLQQVEALGLKRRNGEREYVLVFDWRVLEELTSEEIKCSRSGKPPDPRRFDMRSSESIWRKYWVGLV